MSKSPGKSKSDNLVVDDLDQLLKDEMGLSANDNADSSTDGDDSDDEDFQKFESDDESTDGDELCDDYDEDEDDSESESLAESAESMQTHPPQLPMSCLRGKNIPNFKSVKKGTAVWTVASNSAFENARVHASEEPPDWDFSVINCTSSTDPNMQAYGILQVANGKLPENIANDAQLVSFLDKVQNDPSKFLVFQPLTAARMKEYMKHVCNLKKVKFSPKGYAALVTATAEGDETSDAICKVKEAAAMAACFPFPYVSSAHIKTKKPPAPKSTPPVVVEPNSSAAKPAAATKSQKAKPVSSKSRLEPPAPTALGNKQSPKKPRSSPSRQLFCAPPSNQKRFKSTPSTRDEASRKERAAEPAKNFDEKSVTPALTKKRSVDAVCDAATPNGPASKKPLLVAQPNGACGGFQIEIKATFTDPTAAQLFLKRYETN